MGVDYRGVAGIGIEVTDEIRKKLVVKNEGDYDGDIETLVNEVGFECKEAGDGNYTNNDNTFYIIVEGENLVEINANAEGFIKKLHEAGIEVSNKDLQLIEGLHVW